MLDSYQCFLPYDSPIAFQRCIFPLWSLLWLYYRLTLFTCIWSRCHIPRLYLSKIEYFSINCFAFFIQNWISYDELFLPSLFYPHILIQWPSDICPLWYFVSQLWELFNTLLLVAIVFVCGYTRLESFE